MCKMVEKIKVGADKILERIKKKLDKHEEDVKKKLAGYINITKNGLLSVKTKMASLKEKIECYIQLGGTFEMLGAQLIEYYRDINYNYIKGMKYIWIGHPILKEQEDVIQNISKLQEHGKEYQSKVDGAGNELPKLLAALCCEGSARQLIDDFEKHGKNYTHLLSQIPKIISELKPFKDIWDKIRSKKVTENVLIKIASNKKLDRSDIKDNKKHFDIILPHSLKGNLVIETQYAYKLIMEIISLRGNIFTSIKHMINVKLLIEYLNSFEKQKKTFEEIKINRPGLEAIDKLIRSMRQLRKGYKELIWFIYTSSNKLFSKFEKGDNKTYIYRGSRLYYLPKTMSLDKRPLVKLKNHIKKLEAIQLVSPTASGYSISFPLEIIEKPVKTDIVGLLKELDGMDKILSNSRYIEYYVGKIRGSYDQNKDQINGGGTKNGNGIESYLGKIKEIPDKIPELQTKVRYNIVLLKISISVKETLDKVKGDSEDLQYIRFPLEYIKNQVGNVIQGHGQLFSNIVGVSENRPKLNDLNVFKGNIQHLKEFLRKLKNNINCSTRIMVTTLRIYRDFKPLRYLL